jgi:tRNA (cytidine/uridine-2'-O-)-methyltransferase
MFHVILYQPQIPPNTGNIIRLCANTGCQLHLIEPLGFQIDAAAVRRAGLDYAEMAAVHSYPGIEPCLEQLGTAPLYAIETGTALPYTQARFAPGAALLFGQETSGLPSLLLDRIAPAKRLCIPMRADNRSLNLSNAVAVVVFEAWRQQGFAGASNDA